MDIALVMTLVGVLMAVGLAGGITIFRLNRDGLSLRASRRIQAEGVVGGSALTVALGSLSFIGCLYAGNVLYYWVPLFVASLAFILMIGSLTWASTYRD